jgi:hypothetical protein
MTASDKSTTIAPGGVEVMVGAVCWCGASVFVDRHTVPPTLYNPDGRRHEHQPNKPVIRMKARQTGRSVSFLV